MQKATLLLVEDDEDDAFFFRRTFRESELPYRPRVPSPQP
jgi:hypothetical protein